MYKRFASPFSRHELSQLAAPGTDTFVDGPFGSSLKSHEYVDSGVRLIQLQNIGDGEWRDENRKFITTKKFKGLERHGAIPGDIAIAKMADPVARACIVPPVAEQFVVVADCIRLRLNRSRFDAGFIVRAINSHYTRREAEKKAIGSTRIRINLSVLKTVGCLAPELSEQQTISMVLDAIDTAIHETESIIDKLTALKQGLLHDLLTRGIADSGELRPTQTVAPHLYKQSPLGWIPREWDVKPLGQVLAGPTKSGLYKSSQFHGRGPLMVQMGGLFAGEAADFQTATRVQVSPSELQTFGLSIGDLLFARRSLVFEGAGLCVIVRHLPGPATFESSIVRVRVREDVTHPEFVSQFLRGEQSSAQRRTLIRQVAVSGVSSSDIRQLLIAIPTLAEQNQIVERKSGVQAQIDSELKAIAKLRNQRAGLLDDLLTGRVRVTSLLSPLERQPSEGSA